MTRDRFCQYCPRYSGLDPSEEDNNSHAPNSERITLAAGEQPQVGGLITLEFTVTLHELALLAADEIWARSWQLLNNCFTNYAITGTAQKNIAYVCSVDRVCDRMVSTTHAGNAVLTIHQCALAIFTRKLPISPSTSSKRPSAWPISQKMREYVATALELLLWEPGLSTGFVL